MAETCSHNELEKKLNNHARHALKFYFLWATPKIPELHIEFFGTLACITYHKNLPIIFPLQANATPQEMIMMVVSNRALGCIILIIM